MKPTFISVDTSYSLISDLFNGQDGNTPHLNELFGPELVYQIARIESLIIGTICGFGSMISGA